MGKPFDPTAWIASSQVEAAQVLGIHQRTFADWLSSGCDCKTSRGYSIPHAIEWARNNVWKAPAKAQAPEGLDRMEAAELRKAEADAAIKEAKAEQLVGALVDREAVVGAVRLMMAMIRNRLQAVPEEVGGVVPPEWRADITLDMQDKVALILNEMASWSESQNLDDGTAETTFGSEPDPLTSFGEPGENSAPSESLAS